MDGIDRRRFLGTVAAAASAVSAGALVGCRDGAGASEVEGPSEAPPPEIGGGPEQASKVQETPMPSEVVDTVLEVEALRGMPWPTPDPFLFCVHHKDGYPAGNGSQGPVTSLAGREIGQDFSGRDGWSMYHGDVVPGFPRHPHRGFETVTVARRGYIDHSDSMGATARYGGGDTQWMTAGAGIVHAEMFPLRRQDADNPVELFQIWLNLPREKKMVRPYFTMLWADTIPVHREVDAAGRACVVTTVAGALAGRVPPGAPPDSWASAPGADVAIWTLELEAGATWTLPPAAPGLARSLYFYGGDALKVGTRDVPTGSRVGLRSDAATRLAAGATAVSALMLQGRPIGEPVAKYGPFVMNTQTEIQQAFADYRATGFGGWPWAADDPVHARDQERFALHADGRRDVPG
jgi:redox-sensitive bicupin YhaK (pirin superfamily)